MTTRKELHSLVDDYADMLAYNELSNLEFFREDSNGALERNNESSRYNMLTQLSAAVLKMREV